MTIRTDIGPFAMVPEWVITHPDIKGNDILVYVALAMRASRKTNSCWPGQELIGEDVGLSVATVKRSLSALKEMGAVSWKRTGASNVYTVHQAKPVDSPSVSYHDKADSSSVSEHDSSVVSDPIAHQWAINNKQEQEPMNNKVLSGKPEKGTDVKTNFEVISSREVAMPSAADWDDSPETRNSMAQRIAKDFYAACRAQKAKRPAVKHKQMIKLLDDLIERGYTEEDIHTLFSAHYSSGSPWTLNSIAYTEGQIAKNSGDEPSFEGWSTEEIAEYRQMQKDGVSMLGKVLNHGE